MGAFATKEARSIYYTDGCDIQRVQIGYVLYWALNECNWLWKISLIPSMQANPGTIEGSRNTCGWLAKRI